MDRTRQVSVIRVRQPQAIIVHSHVIMKDQDIPDVPVG
ncbi:unnamed protein product [Brugia pahangi]|uniref:Transposase n=1 Tax=Brugia pahangi TaxID=6280 RepID=A0A0N4T7C8_BRUPA|nr:unnamed protein product [Brugia pahangi]